MPPLLDYQPQRPRPNPPALIVAGAIFIAVGAIGIGQMILNPFFGRGITIDICSPFVLIFGIGLLRRIPPCYDMARLLVWLPMLTMPPLALYSLTITPKVTISGHEFLPPWLATTVTFLLCACIFGVAVWVFRTLRRPDIKTLFETPRPPSNEQ